MTDTACLDMTLPLRDGMQLFPGLPAFESKSSITEETGALTRRFTSSTHQGTHVDAPAHYVDGPTLEEFELDRWRGEATVVDLRDRCGEEITADVLADRAGQIRAGERLLLLTGDVDAHFGDPSFFDRAAVLTPGAAGWLVERDVGLVANDFLTEALDDPERPVHHTILGAGIPIVEYLCNADAVAEAETVAFTCFPLNLPGFEASPVRAVAYR